MQLLNNEKSCRRRRRCRALRRGAADAATAVAYRCRARSRRAAAAAIAVAAAAALAAAAPPAASLRIVPQYQEHYKIIVFLGLRRIPQKPNCVVEKLRLNECC